MSLITGCSIDGVEWRTLERHIDQRGWLLELFRKDEFLPYIPLMAYMSITQPGNTRGPHVHLSQTDWLIFPGPGSVVLGLMDDRVDSSTPGATLSIRGGDDHPLAILVPPGVIHGFRCVSAEPVLLVNFPDCLYQGVGRTQPVDEVRYESESVWPRREEFMSLLGDSRCV